MTLDVRDGLSFDLDSVSHPQPAEYLVKCNLQQKAHDLHVLSLKKTVFFRTHVNSQRVNDHKIEQVDGGHQVGWASALETHCLCQEHSEEPVQWQMKRHLVFFRLKI